MKQKATRLLSLLLVLCMLLGLSPSMAFAADGAHPFTDVSDTAWYSDAVQYVYEHDMMVGTGDTKFSPDSPTSRAMIVTILHRMEGTPSATGIAFTDVPVGQWYTDAVAWASANSIVSGYGNGKFGPEDPITREQMAAITYRYVQYKEYDAAITGNAVSFSDGNQVSSWAVDAVNWAIGVGLLQGVGNNNLSPTGGATRAQAATILMRFCKDVVPSDTTVEPTPAKSYKISFELNYGNAGTYQTIEVEDGKTVAQPTNPTRGGYSFAGWYTSATGGTKFDFSTAITEDMTLYAHWNTTGGASSSTSRPTSTPTPDETPTPGDISYKAPTENDIESGLIEFDGGSYTAEYVNNQLILVFNDGEDNKAEQLVAAYGASIVGRIETIGIYQIEFDSRKELNELNSIMTEIKANPAVEDAYLNTVLEHEDTAIPFYPNDSWDIEEIKDADGKPVNSIWDELLPADNNWGAEAINAPSAWQLLIDEHGSIFNVPHVSVGIIDNYIDMTHEDLARNAGTGYWYQKNLLKKDPTDETFAEYAAAADNWDDYKTIVHGTHVAGTIGARMGNGGINGIAINPELHGVSMTTANRDAVYEKQTIFASSTALADLIEDSVCKVINYSMGYPDEDYKPNKAKRDGEKVAKVLENYLDKEYDFLIVTAAGNNSVHEAEYNSFYNAISSEINETVKSHIIVVGNAQNDGDGTFSYYTDGKGQCSGSRVDVFAPGTKIYSTVSPNEESFSVEINGVMNEQYKANSKYLEKTGTSMAAPHVSGVAALIWAADEQLRGDRVKEIIMKTATIPVDGVDYDVYEEDDKYPHGMVNAAYAVSEALGLEYTVDGTCGTDMTWTLDTDGNLTIRGSGEMTWSSIWAPWYRYREIIKNVTIEDGITSIHDSAFDGCSEVTAVELGSDIKSIGSQAFFNMKNLHSITIPDSVQSIGVWALGYINNGTERISEFTIYGYAGTAAEIYAKDTDNNFKFVDLTSEEPTPSPSPTISGMVVDSNTEQPIESVNIYVYDENGYGPYFTGTTDANGAYTITIAEAGTYYLKFSKSGYEDYELKNVTVPENSTSLGTVKLSSVKGDESFVGGDGTDENPYQISTPQQFNNIRNNLGASYILINDANQEKR